ncbi:hypothetical protein [Dactylosporangium sp. CA-233914]|uniref:hypothetical protein n=1 Tax=Dactylosporangium sp. CA-233914 TaxID=3239934 RepID=UPI003D93BA75
MMDRYLGSQVGAPLARSGSASGRIAATVAGNESPESLLAAIYWWTVTQSPRFADALHAIGAEGAPTHQILVAHAQGTRFNLLVMVDGFERGPRRLPMNLDQLVLADSFFRSQAARTATAADRLRQKYPEVSVQQVREAIREISRAQKFGILVVGTQPEEPTRVPVPPVGVSTDATANCATVGAILVGSRPSRVTTALHAVESTDCRINIGDANGTVIVRDATTDSCIVEIDGSLAVESLVGLAGVRRAVLPGIGEPAAFYRTVEGRIDTEILGVDISALDPQQSFASKVYTKPLTRPGDSGAALIDTSDRIVAFAVARSSIQASIAYSVWIWAEQTFTALGIDQ